MGKVPTSYEVKEAARLSRLPVTMVDYLCRMDILVPTVSKSRGRGHRRRYSFGDVVMLRVLARMLKAGVEVSKLRVALKGLRKQHPEITPTSLPAALLVTDGRAVYLRDKNAALEDVASGQMAFAFVLELSKVTSQIASESSSTAQRRARSAA